MSFFDINAHNALRYFSLTLDSELDNYRQTSVSHTTWEEVCKAEIQYNEFYESLPDEHKLRWDCFNAVWDLVLAYEMKGREEGMKAGIGLIIGTLTNDPIPVQTPSKPRQRKAKPPLYLFRKEPQSMKKKPDLPPDILRMAQQFQQLDMSNQAIIRGMIAEGIMKVEQAKRIMADLPKEPPAYHAEGKILYVEKWRADE